MKCLSAKFVLVAVVAAIALLVAQPATRAQTYQPAVDLGVYNTPQYNSGTTSEAWGISENGNITGWASFKVTVSPYAPPDYRPTAFLWKPTTANGIIGTMTNCKALGDTQGEGYHDGHSSTGRAVNNSGTVVGFDATAQRGVGGRFNAGTFGDNAILWSPSSNGTNGVLYGLGYFVTTVWGQERSGISSSAFAVTNTGRVFGGAYYAVPGSTQADPVGWRLMGFNYTMTQPYVTLNFSADAIGTIPNGYDTVLYNANEAGQAVGRSFLGALLYNVGSITDLGLFGGTDAFATGINDQGTLVGTRKLPNALSVPYQVGFLWKPDVVNGTTGTYTDIGPYTDNIGRQWNVVPTAVNFGRSTTVVGYLWHVEADGSDYRELAFLWRSQTGMVLLDDLQADVNWKFLAANDINNNGQIVGYGNHTFTNSQGATVTYRRAFLLQPSSKVDR